MNQPDCIFCKIISGQIPSTKVFENEHVLGFKDLHPQAALHYLFIHKKHTRNVNEMTVQEPQQLVDIFAAIRDFTATQKLDQPGFRVVTNLGPDGGQTVFHTHFHVLGGEQLRGFGR